MNFCDGFFFANQLIGTNYGSGENSLEVDPLEKSGKDSRGIIEDFMEKDPLALPVENPREIPRVKFVNSIEKNGVIVLTLDDDTCKSKSKHFFLISFHSQETHIWSSELAEENKIEKMRKNIR